MTDVNLDLLRAIGNANAANTVVYVSQADGLPLVQGNLITVDRTKPDPNDASKIAATITTEGAKLIANGSAEHTKAIPAANVQIGEGGFVRPKAKRGGGKGTGAPTKYPFDNLQIGQFFFIADSEVSKGDAFKTMGSAVGSANQRYSEGTGEHETVNRAKRGKDHKTLKNGDGSNVMEQVTVEKKKALRKFVVSKVEAGKVYGSFTAPSNGAVVMREALPVAPAPATA